MRGQLFTADLIIAVAILVVGLGVVLQHAELAQRAATDRLLLSSPASEPIAQAIANRQAFVPSHHCAKYGNGTDDCSDSSCNSCASFDPTCANFGGRVFVSQRLVTCTSAGVDSACLLEVHTCQ